MQPLKVPTLLQPNKYTDDTMHIGQICANVFCVSFSWHILYLLLYFVSAWLGKVKGHCDRNPGSDQGNLWWRNEEAGRGLRGQYELPATSAISTSCSVLPVTILASNTFSHWFRTVLPATAVAQYFRHCFASLILYCISGPNWNSIVPADVPLCAFDLCFHSTCSVTNFRSVL